VKVRPQARKSQRKSQIGRADQTAGAEKSDRTDETAGEEMSGENVNKESTARAGAKSGRNLL